MSPLTHPPSAYLRALAMAVDAKGNYFPGHSESVSYVLRLMALDAGFSDGQVRQLQIAALIHDAGKLMVPEDILLANRSLTTSEWTTMRRHPEWSATIAQQTAEGQDVVEIVLHHHEHFDGTGYPDGLAGERIPLESRMLLVADAFSVMTTDRPYRRARRRGEAIEVLQENAGTQFDPQAVEMLASRASQAS